VSLASKIIAVPPQGSYDTCSWSDESKEGWTVVGRVMSTRVNRRGVHESETAVHCSFAKPVLYCLGSDALQDFGCLRVKETFLQSSR
jgi:hypothetical protein